MKKVLVVEDNPLNLELIVEILRGHDISVDTAGDGNEAVAKEKEKSFDLILMDIELPIMDGVEATTIIKKNHKDIPVIALTSYAMKGDKERFLEAGFDDYISKPIEIHEFLRKLQKYNI